MSIATLSQSPFFLKQGQMRNLKHTGLALSTLPQDTPCSMPICHCRGQGEWQTWKVSSFMYFLGQFVSYTSMHCTPLCSDCTSAISTNRQILAMLSISQEKNNRTKILLRTLKLVTKTEQENLLFHSYWKTQWPGLHLVSYSPETDYMLMAARIQVQCNPTYTSYSFPLLLEKL